MKTTLLWGVLCICTSAHATVITFNFDSPTGSQGTSHTYTFSGYSITATAFGSGSPNLYGKNAGGDENGLGLSNDPSGDHEITPGSFIQLNLSNILSFTPLLISINSSTGTDAWKIYETNTAGTLSGATLLLSGSNESSHSISPTDTYLDITASCGNVLLSSLSFDDGSIPPQSIPEPASLSMMGAGVGLIGWIARRRKIKMGRS